MIFDKSSSKESQIKIQAAKNFIDLLLQLKLIEKKELSFKNFIGNIFVQEKFLPDCLIHPTIANDNNFSSGFQLLEYLGDAVLYLETSKFLIGYKKTKKLNEGELSVVRQKFISTKILTKISTEINLEKYLIISKGQNKNKKGSKILADAFESFLGSLYLYDKEKVPFFLKNTLFKHIVKNWNSQLVEKDSKTQFQEMIQGNLKNEKIRYTSVKRGDRFEVTLHVGNQIFGKGISTSIKKAEQIAAKKAIDSSRGKNWN